MLLSHKICIFCNSNRPRFIVCKTSVYTNRMTEYFWSAVSGDLRLYGLICQFKKIKTEEAFEWLLSLENVLTLFYYDKPCCLLIKFNWPSCLFWQLMYLREKCGSTLFSYIKSRKQVSRLKYIQTKYRRFATWWKTYGTQSLHSVLTHVCYSSKLIWKRRWRPVTSTRQ